MMMMMMMMMMMRSYVLEFGHDTEVDDMVCNWSVSRKK
jgi:hypothetical protein